MSPDGDSFTISEQSGEYATDKYDTVNIPVIWKKEIEQWQEKKLLQETGK